MRRSTASLIYLVIGIVLGLGFSFYCGYAAGNHIEDYDDPRGYITKDDIINNVVAQRDNLYKLVHYGYFAVNDDIWNDVLIEDPKFSQAWDNYISSCEGDTEDLLIKWQ